MNPWIVSKFGGTSMGDARAMQKSAEIVRKQPHAKLVVVSATAGTTNELLNLFHLLEKGQAIEAKEKALSIEKRHHAITLELHCTDLEKKKIQVLYSELYQLCAEEAWIQKTNQEPKKLAFLDQLLSLGERLSSELFTIALSRQGIAAQCFDVRKILITDDQFGKAQPLLFEITQKSNDLFKTFRESDQIYVVQGFIGATPTGETTTLGRGGSDFTAALLAESFDAQELQIWTDVPGIMTMDPHCVTDAQVIPKMSFAEAAELANFGAKVIHPATIWPAVRKKIQIFVGSTFEPDRGGTWIYPELSPTPLENLRPIRAIALRKEQTLITVTSLRMLNTHGFLAKLFGILANHQISIDLVTTSEVSVAITIDQNSLGSFGKLLVENPKFLKMIEELKKFCEVSIELDLTLVALVGEDLTQIPHLNARTFSSIGQSRVRLVCYGASRHSLCFLVKQEEALQIATQLHSEWISPNPLYSSERL